MLVLRILLVHLRAETKIKLWFWYIPVACKEFRVPDCEISISVGGISQSQ